MDSLDPFTMYEITVKAENKYGSSQATNPIRGVTMIPKSPHSMITKTDAPAVPDIKSCCIRKGLNVCFNFIFHFITCLYKKATHIIIFPPQTNLNCVQKLCDPEKSDQTVTEDFILCAPFVDKTFSCLANGVDHTNCCLQRGLPDICKPLCSGNISNINYSHFVCVKHMPALTNCVLQVSRNNTNF